MQTIWALHRFYPVSSERDLCYIQGDPVSSGFWCLIDRVTLSAVGVDVLLTGWPCQQWVLMSYWQGDPVSNGFWCLIDRVTLSAVGFDVLLTGWPCQQWGLMSYWQGDPVSSGCWCLIDRATLSAVEVDVLLTMLTGSVGFNSGCSCLIDRVTLSAVGVHVLLTGWPCQQWVFMSYWKGEPVSSGGWCHRILSLWLIIDGFEFRLLGLPELMQPYWMWAYLWLYGWCITLSNSLLFAAATFLLQCTLNSTWWLDLQLSNVLFHFSHFEEEAPAFTIAAILKTHVLFAGTMEAWCVGNTDWLIISLSITRINALLTGVSLSIATVLFYLY